MLVPESLSSVAAILTLQPPSISGMQALSPSALDRVVAACLTKDPADRWRDAGDRARELKWIAVPASQDESPKPRTRDAESRGSWIPWTLAAAAVVAALTVSW